MKVFHQISSVTISPTPCAPNFNTLHGAIRSVAPAMSFGHLVVKPASEAQVHEAQLRSGAYWGVRAGVSIDDFLKLHPVLQQGVFAKNGKLQYWVLVSKDDPESTGFYASCQVLARDILTLHPGQTSPSCGFGHAISFVIVPPEHRGKGYAQCFMSLLHSALAPHRYPNILQVPTTTSRSSSVSVLYSAVGDYYARCIPVAGESGWIQQKSWRTTWPLSSIRIPPKKAISLPVELLSESDVTKVLDSDDTLVPADLLELQKKNPKKTFFAFVPTSPLNTYFLTMSKLAMGGLSNNAWGAQIPGSKDFMTWVIFNQPTLKVVITRIRASPESFPVLLDAALRVAQDAKCEGIEIGNIPAHLKEIAKASGGVTTRWDDHLPAFKWYGEGSEAAGADAVWAMEERYSWC
ncbi:hypothetical protein RHS04_07867 [Rhizoctonia solani]|uniref:LYC1 C-terminal domain-containing protein n=1 Tax=Rhizoctonia solani TaxID=456999 RepID=A0A8H7H2R7_9AGAM|nr:hypothetical protein RHS04_07867 [Rhizoctonia solani]